MATIAVIHVRQRSRDSLTTDTLKKGAARSHEVVSGASADDLLSSFLLTSFTPANGILPTHARPTLPITQHELPTHARPTLPIHVLTQHELPMRALTALPAPVPTEQAPSTQARIALPSNVLTQHVLPADVRTTLPIHALATLAPHIRITLPSGVLAGAWTRTFHEDPERPGFFTGITALDHEIGSIPKAALTQVCAPQRRSSGKAAILCSLLAHVTDAEEVCALIDAGNCFNPSSAAMAGVDLSRLLWVRCGKKMKTGFAKKSTADPHATARTHTAIDRDATTNFRPTTNYQSITDSHATNSCASITSSGATTGCQSIASSQAMKAGLRPTTGYARRMQPIEEAFKAADILIQNGGFGLIAIDLGEIEERLVRKIPLTTWFRFARVIERQPTALVVFATYPAAQRCAALTLHIKNAAARWHTGALAHAQCFSGLSCEVEPGKVRGRVRKPAQSAKAGFTAAPVWK
jgi:recombination protein RecA